MSLIAHTVDTSAWVMVLSKRACGSRVKLTWQRQGCSSVWWEGWVVGHLKRTMTKSGTEQPLLWCGFKRTKFSQQISQNTSQAMQEKCQSCSSVESLGFLQRVTCLLFLQLPPGRRCPEEPLSKGSHGWGIEAESTCSPCLLTTRDFHLGVWLPWIKTTLFGWVWLRCRGSKVPLNYACNRVFHYDYFSLMYHSLAAWSNLNCCSCHPGETSEDRGILTDRCLETLIGPPPWGGWTAGWVGSTRAEAGGRRAGWGTQWVAGTPRASTVWVGFQATTKGC